MLNLREYKNTRDRLCDLLPWAGLVAPGVVLNKDGSFQRTFMYRGHDLASATATELKVAAAHINNVFKRLPGGWALYSESQRIQSQVYPESKFDSIIPLMIDEQRRLFFSSGVHYENNYYLTLVYLPPPENFDKLNRMIIQRQEKEKETYHHHKKNFLTETNRFYQLFRESMSETEPLDDEETLTYLHSCVSPKRHPVKVPEVPMYLDAILPDSPLVGGMEPKLGNYHLRTISILGFPGSSYPGIIDNLNWLNFEYRFVCRYLPLDKIDAKRELKKFKNKWFAKRKGALTLFREQMQQKESPIVDSDAINKSMDADEALQELGADYVNFGYFTASVTIWDKDLSIVERKVNEVVQVINNLGFTTINESLNAVEAWLGSLPGLYRANVRRPLFNSLNLSHVFPVSAIWAGPVRNKHLNGPVLMHVQTPANTPFRLNIHIGDVGHTNIIGPTGNGKSVLLATMAAQFLRYEDAQVYIFDKDKSSLVITAGVGGDFYDLMNEDEKSLSFQPLAGIDDENERAWAAEWLHDILRKENVVITPQIKKDIWAALGALATSPKEQRTITGLSLMLQNKDLRMALEPFTIKGAFGRLFDATEDKLSYGRWQAFEMGKLMETPSAVGPAEQYLFHMLEKRFNGNPTLFYIDEGFYFLDESDFAKKIKNWLKTLRKANVSVVFSTQSPTDVTESEIANIINECCFTKIYLPNTKAFSPDIAASYQSLGLNEKELEILATMTPKREYYYKSEKGSRVFELALSPFELAYVGASSKEEKNMADHILSKYGREGFNEEWLRYKNLDHELQVYQEIKGGVA